MLTLVFLIPSLILFSVLLFTYNGQSKLNNGILFGVTVSKKALDHPEIKALQEAYKKQYITNSIVILVLFIPLFFLENLFAFQMIYFFVWIGVLLFLMTSPYRAAFRTTMRLKRENDWFVGEKRVVRADIKVAQMKEAMSISSYWFAIPLIMSIVPIIISFSQEDSLLRYTGIAAFLMTLVMFGISKSFQHSKAKVYSKKTDINLALNRTNRRYWSILWLSLAIFETINAYIAYFLLTSETTITLAVWIGSITIISLLPLAGILYVHFKVKSIEQSLLECDSDVIYTDDDEYWANGFTYHNPNDKSIMVPKRVGIGTTINTGNPVGKSIYYGLLGLTAVLIIGVSLMIVRSEYTSPELLIKEDGVITIDYPMYNFSFNVDEIEELSLIEKVPSGFKSNGEATSKYARGNFKLDEYGKTKLYIFKKSPPYIVFKLNDLYVIYNDAEPALTKQLFAELNALRK